MTAPTGEAITWAAGNTTPVQLLEIKARIHPEQPPMPVIRSSEGGGTVTNLATRDRIYAAIANSGEEWLRNLTWTVRGRGTHRDLAIAVAGLAAAGTLPADGLHNIVFHGELGLDGSVHSPGLVLEAAAAAVRRSQETGQVCTLYVPTEEAGEAQLAIRVIHESCARCRRAQGRVDVRLAVSLANVLLELRTS